MSIIKLTPVYDELKGLLQEGDELFANSNTWEVYIKRAPVKETTLATRVYFGGDSYDLPEDRQDAIETLMYLMDTHGYEEGSVYIYKEKKSGEFVNRRRFKFKGKNAARLAVIGAYGRVR